MISRGSNVFFKRYINFMSSDVERIKELLNIADVVGEYVDLKPAGSYYKANCPFHKEKTPSFIVTPDRGTYRCFGCGASGDVFSFVQEFEGLDFKGALRLLGSRAGVEIKERGDGAFKKKRDRLFVATEKATEFFEESLINSKNALKYLRERGVLEKTQKEWRLGYAPAQWRALYENLLGGGVTETDMKEAGLIKMKENKTYDTFRDRLIFPIFDASDNIIAFSGRALNPTDKAPKYLNSPDTEIFNKSEVLYGLNKAGRSIRRTGYAVLVEGQFDMIMSQQAGVENTVALSGTSVTDEHIKRLKRFAKNILLAFDSDEAGIHSAYKTAALAFKEGMDVKIARLPKDKDPADCIRENRSEWKRILTDAPHAVLHTLNYIKETFSEKRKRINAIHEFTFPMISLIESEMDQSYFIGIIADELNIPFENVRADVERYSSRNLTERTTHTDRRDFKEIDHLLDRSDVPRVEKITNLAAVLLRWLENSSQAVYSAGLLRSQIDSVDPDFAEKISKREEEMEGGSETAEMEFRYGILDTSGVVSYSDELVFRFKTARLEEKIEDLQKKIKETNENEDIDQEALSEYQQYSRELHDIRASRSEGEARYITE